MISFGAFITSQGELTIQIHGMFRIWNFFTNQPSLYSGSSIIIHSQLWSYKVSHRILNRNTNEKEVDQSGGLKSGSVHISGIFTDDAFTFVPCVRSQKKTCKRLNWYTRRTFVFPGGKCQNCDTPEIRTPLCNSNMISKKRVTYNTILSYHDVFRNDRRGVTNNFLNRWRILWFNHMLKQQKDTVFPRMSAPVLVWHSALKRDSLFTRQTIIMSSFDQALKWGNTVSYDYVSWFVWKVTSSSSLIVV